MILCVTIPSTNKVTNIMRKVHNTPLTERLPLKLILMNLNSKLL